MRRSRSEIMWGTRIGWSFPTKISVRGVAHEHDPSEMGQYGVVIKCLRNALILISLVEASQLLPLYQGSHNMRACDRCHRRKSKCGQIHPVCGPCKKAGAACRYVDRKKQTREVEGLQRRFHWAPSAGYGLGLIMVYVAV